MPRLFTDEEIQARQEILNAEKQKKLFTDEEIAERSKTYTYQPSTYSLFQSLFPEPEVSAPSSSKTGLTSTSTKKTAVSTGGPGKTPNIQPVHSAVSTHTAGISNDYAVPEIDTAGMSSDEIKRQIQRLEDTIAIERNRAVATKPQEELNGFQKMLGALSTPEQRRKAAELPSARLQQNDKVKRLESQLNDLKADQYYRSREAEYNQLSEREKEDLAFAVASQNLAVEGAGNTKSADIVEKYLRKYGAEFGSLPYDLTAYPDEIRRLTREQSETFATLMDARMRQTLEKKGLDYDFLMEYGTRLYNQEKREADKKKNELAAQEHPIASNVGSVLATLGKPAGFFNTSRHYFSQTDSDEYIPLDINSPDFGAANYQSDIREKTAENIDSNAGKFLYQTGMSIADFVSLLPLNLVPGGAAASTAILGSGAATDTAIDVANRGGTVSQAFLSGIAAGAAEAVFEKFSLDAILKAGKVTGIKSFIKEFLKGAGVEGSEEAATEIANILSDHAIMGDKSNYSVSVQSYIDSGMTREQAEKAAMEDLAKQVGMAFAGGVVSGGAIHGVQGGVSLAQQIGAKAKGHPATPDADFSASGLTSETGSREVPVARIPQNGSTVNAAGTSASPRPAAYQVADMSAQAKKRRSDVVRETGAAVQVDPAIIDTVAKVAENTGRNIQFVETLGTGRNGKYDASTGTLYVAADSRNPVMTVLRHELTHSLEGTQAYAELSDYITTQIAAEAELNLEDIIEAKIAQYAESGEALTRDGAIAELVADYAGDNLFTSDAAIRRLSAEKPSVARRILNWIRSMKTRLFGTREAKMLARAEQLYHDALMAPFRKGDGVQYKLNPNFQSEYDAWVKDGRKSGGYFRLGTTSEALESIGINPANIYWDKSKINRIQKDHPEMTDAVIKAVPQMLEDPMLVMQSLTVPNRVVVFGDLAAENGKPVLAALELRPSGEIENVIKVASAYSKSTLQNLIDNSDILYVHPNKNRTDSWLEARRLQLPVGLTNYGSIGNVTYTDRNVNGEYTFEGNTPQKTAMQLAFEQAGRNNTNTSISENASDDAQYSRGVSSGDTIADIKAMVERYGAIKRGEAPARDVQIPRQTNDNTRVRQFVRTAAESAQVPDEFIGGITQDVMNEVYSYVPISNQDAMNRAVRTVETLGLDKAIEQWNAAANGDKAVSKYDMALGEYLLVLAGQNNDPALASKLIIDLATLGTEAGQVVQAASMLKRMTPEGQLMALQRIVERVNRENIKTNRGGNEPVKIPQDIIDRMQRVNPADTETMDKIFKDGLVAVAEQVPPTLMDKWNAWRYLAMLGNPRTHIRNIVGNAVFTPVIRIKDFLAGAIETAVDSANRAAGGKGIERTKTALSALPFSKRREYLDFARRDYQQMKPQLDSNGRLNPSDIIRDNRPVFTSKLGKPLEAAREANSKAMQAEDGWFKKLHYQRALMQYLAANKIDVASIDKETLNRARNYAMREALKATFSDDSAFANFLSRAAKSNKAAQVIIEGVTPFKKTPINIAKRAVEYSPAGLVDTVTRKAHQLKTGKINAAEFIDSLAAGLTGSGIVALGMWLASKGILTGGLGNDEEDQQARLQGAQEYALNIDDVSYTLDWASPVALPLFVGAEIEKLRQESKEGEVPFSKMLESLANITEPMVNMSMLQGINDSIEQVKYSDNELTNLALNTATGYLGQGVPTLFGQIARTVDDTRRRNYTEQGSAFPTLQTAFQRSKSKIPGLLQTQQPYVDAWGREESSGNLAQRVFDNFISPGYSSRLQSSPMEEELVRLNREVGEEADNAILPSAAAKSFTNAGDKVVLTAAEYTDYQKKIGQTSYELLSDLTGSAAYRRLSDEQKAKAVGEIYKYARDLGKKEILTERGESYTPASVTKKIEAAVRNGISIPDYLTFSVRNSELESDKKPNGDTVSGSKKRKTEALLREMGITGRQRQVLLALAGYGSEAQRERILSGNTSDTYQETDIDRLLRGALS